MKYNPAKKIIILLKEYEQDAQNGYLEDEICNAIYELEQNEYADLYQNSTECLEQLGFDNMDDLISYLDYLPADIGERQGERAIARSEAFHEYIYENGYDTYMTQGW